LALEFVMNQSSLPAILLMLSFCLSEASAQSSNPDPLALPFPKFSSMKELSEFSTQVQVATQDRLVAARSRGDRLAACRTLERAELFRLHAAQTFRRLQATQR